MERMMHKIMLDTQELIPCEACTVLLTDPESKEVRERVSLCQCTLLCGGCMHSRS